MSEERRHIEDSQIAAYLTGELEDREKVIVEEWISESEENEQYFNTCKKVFDLKYPHLEAAANVPTFDSGSAWDDVEKRLDFIDGSLEEVDELLDDQLEQVDQMLAEQTVSVPWLRIAAVVVIVLGSVFLLMQKPWNTSIELVASSEAETFYLPDSTKVVLDQNSSVKYSKDYNISNRDLELDGKAYFDVKRNEAIPMNISSKLGIVTVLGTSFEVDESNDSICVVVETGLVRLISASDNSISIDLKELESATLTGTSNTIDRKSVANLNHLYWATQKIVYRQALLPNIFEELSEIFGKSIDYDSSTIQNCRMTAIFNNQTFEEILQNMALSMDFEYSIDSNQVTIKSGGCEDL